MANVHTDSPTREVAQALQGIDFPADKSSLVEYARTHGANDGVLERLNGIPESQYTNMADVFKGIGQSK